MQDQQTERTMFELQTTVERYPFDQSARIAYIEKLFALHDETFGRELRKASLFVPDRKVLFYTAEGERYNIIPVVNEDMKKSEASDKKPQDTDRTATLINDFLLEMPDEQPKRRLTLADATTDYAAYIDQQESLCKDKTESMPISQVKKNEVKRELPDTSTQMVDIDTSTSEDVSLLSGEKKQCLTETLAKIYIKQGKYEGAIEIMRKLNADNPKKSCYFADQIRFLEKVVINNKNKK